MILHFFSLYLYSPLLLHCNSDLPLHVGIDHILCTFNSSRGENKTLEVNLTCKSQLQTWCFRTCCIETPHDVLKYQIESVESTLLTKHQIESIESNLWTRYFKRPFKTQTNVLLFSSFMLLHINHMDYFFIIFFNWVWVKANTRF